MDDAGVTFDNVQLTIVAVGTIASDGGHVHGGGGFGSFTPSTRTTANGGQATYTYNVGPGAQRVYVVFDALYEGDTYQLTSCNSIRIAEQEEDYEWLGTSSNYVLIGSTTTHPDNHYGKPAFNSSLHGLAAAYNAQWSLRLAYNDGTLVWGGVFDLNSDWAPPHVSHNIGVSQDVRANGGADSIPFDTDIRTWFVQKVEDLFGFSPLHESAGTGNEHYHIRG
jgi:hypothetical protein